MVWLSASLLGSGTDTKAWGGMQAGRRLQHPAPTHEELALAPLLWGWGRGVSVWFSGISCMPWKLAWAVRGSREGSRADGRGVSP